MINLLALTGFLGAGKTTTMLAAAKALQEQGRKVAVVTNDQGTDLVDSTLARSSLDASGEITGGCFCCKFDDLAEVVQRLTEGGEIDTVIAEAVGSCTDLQATVVRPLRKYHGDLLQVGPLTTVIDPFRYQAFRRSAERGDAESDLSYLFRQQLTEGDVIVLNKTDLLKPEQEQDILRKLRQDYPGARIVSGAARHGTGLADLLAAWEEAPSNSAVSLDIDYDRYAAAEAELAWLNQSYILDVREGFDATAWGREALEHLSDWAAREDAVIGHVKLTLAAGDGDFTKFSLVGAGDEPSLDQEALLDGRPITAVVNARVATSPPALDIAVGEAVGTASRTAAVTYTASDTASFAPSYPRPIHRLTPAEA